jgi:hypothetical protein
MNTDTYNVLFLSTLSRRKSTGSCLGRAWGVEGRAIRKIQIVEELSGEKWFINGSFFGEASNFTKKTVLPVQKWCAPGWNRIITL